MHQTKKGNQWHFGMKLHIGTGPRGLARHLEGTAVNVHDLTPSGQLLHGEEEQVRADAGYRGVGKRAEHAHREVSWQIAMPPGQRGGQGRDGEGPDAGVDGASVPDRERVFGYDMVRHRGLKRNVQRLALLLGFSNLMIAQPSLS